MLSSLLVFVLASNNPTSTIPLNAAPQPPAAWPPPVAQVSEESPALSPDAALKTFVLPPGYRIELVASEPMIQDPIAVDVDPDGRLWVLEMRGFMPNAAGDQERAPVGRISVLEDDDDDGKMDRSTVFLDGLVLPRSLKVLDHGVLVAEPPHLWLARDTNGDLKADTKESVREDFGRPEGNPEHNANGFLWGLDNWLYTSEHDGHLRWKNGAFEYAKTLVRGQWGVSMDDMGRVYRNWNESPIYVDLFPARYFLRNPHVVRTRGVYEQLMQQKDMTVWPVRPTRGVNRGYREGLLRPDGSITTYVSAGTPVVYRGDRLPADVRGNVFITEPAGNLVHRLLLGEDQQGRVHVRNAYPRGEFLASTDERFRPVNLFSAPDGSLLVVDMYRGIIQHGTYQSEYLKQHILAHKLDQPIGYGRIYRVVHTSTTREKKPSLSKQPVSALVELLSHPNGWWRDTAQRLLVERGNKSDTALVSSLRERATTAPDERTRLHALWTLDGLDAMDVETVTHALADKSPHVRASAVRLAEPWLREANHPLHAAVLSHAEDPAWAVRLQIALSLGEMPWEARERPLVTLLASHGNDPIVVDAIVSSLKDHETSALEDLLTATVATGDAARTGWWNRPRAGAAAAGATEPATRQGGAARALASRQTRDDAVAMLAGAIMNSGDVAAMAKLFDVAAEPTRTAWQLSAIMRGAEMALPGGGPGRGGLGPGVGSAAALAAGGGAGGPGGGAGGPGGLGGPGPAAAVIMATLPSAPASLLGLEKSTSREVASSASRIAAALDWPGKPKPAIVVKPLNAEEQKRFTAGQQIFQNLCAACHQVDGRGQTDLAPPLVGSKWVLGRAGYMARIVLNGKEGTRLMPPLSMLSDEQVASVLTYVRRSFGNTASPVDADLIHEVRGASGGRQRPWTEDELAKVSQPDGPPRITR